jgi:hypothetical protein
MSPRIVLISIPVESKISRSYVMNSSPSSKIFIDQISAFSFPVNPHHLSSNLKRLQTPFYRADKVHVLVMMRGPIGVCLSTAAIVASIKSFTAWSSWVSDLISGKGSIAIYIIPILSQSARSYALCGFSSGFSSG